MTEVAFKATYSDWRIVKSRKVVQLVFELPIETADQAYQVLGGMPNMASEIWCGIARLKQGSPAVSQAEKQPGPDTHPVPPARADKERRKWSQLTCAQQAGIRCADPVFWAFLRETHRSHCNDESDAADYVRHLCGVASRKDIAQEFASGLLWESLDAAYDDWQAMDRMSA